MNPKQQKSAIKKLSVLESELVDLIALIDNEELMDKFLEWQSQRATCNQGFVDFIDSLKKEE